MCLIGQHAITFLNNIIIPCTGYYQWRGVCTVFLCRECTHGYLQWNSKWTELDGIIEYIFETNLIRGLTDFVEGPSAAKDLFNLGQLIPASGAAAVCFVIIVTILLAFQVPPPPLPSPPLPPKKKNW